MNTFVQGFVVLDGQGAEQIADWRPDASEPEADAARKRMDALPEGAYWAITLRFENGKRLCRLSRVVVSGDGDSRVTTFVRVDTHHLLGDSFSERFKRMEVEGQRGKLEKAEVPEAVIQAYFSRQIGIADAATLSL